MGLEATWSLVDIPPDARDAAQAAARREGVPVGEWLTRRILRRFSELNVREQEDSFVLLRNHVAELADRLDRFEGHARAEPMREALQKLHQGLTRLNDELVQTAGHSAIQISQLSNSLGALSGSMDDVRTQDAQSRDGFERRMAQLQEFVDGMNFRHAAETRAIASRVDSLSGTLAESRRLIAGDRSAIERLEGNLAKADAEYGGNFRATDESFAKLSEKVERVGSAATDSLMALDQRVDSLKQELGSSDTRRHDETQAVAGKLDAVRGRLDELRADTTDMCGALDRRVLLLQQGFQAQDTRQAESTRSLTQGVESVFVQIEALRTETGRISVAVENRIAELQQTIQTVDGRQREASQATLDTRNLQTAAGAALAQLEQHVNELTARPGAADDRLAAIEHHLSELADRTGAAERQVKDLAARPMAAADDRLAAIEHNLSALADRTAAAESSVSTLQPKTEAVATQLEKLNLRLDNEIQIQQQTMEQMKASLFEQTLNALGDRLETESSKQQAAISGLKNGLLDELAQAFDHRVDAEDRKLQDAMAQLQSSFALALHSLGETFESQAQKQQDAIAELKASLTAAPQSVPLLQTQSVVSAAAEPASPVETTHVEHTEEPGAPTSDPNLAAASFASQHDEDLPLELTSFADARPAHAEEHLALDQRAETAPVPDAAEPPPFAQHTSDEHLDLHTPVLAGMESLSPAAVMARNSAADLTSAPSLLSAARQSLQSTTTRTEAEDGKELPGMKFLRSLPTTGKQMTQTSSYALLAGIGLLVVVAIAVGAMELTHRSEAPLPAHFSPMRATVLSKPSHGIVKRAFAKTLVPASTPAPAAAAAVSTDVDHVTARANAGDAQAQLLAGLRALTKNDNLEAAKWLERAAARGLPVAEYRLATLYAAGRGLPADKAKAFRWYLAAAQAGNRKAMSNLAVAYAQGDGTTKNPQEAGRWFLKAAQLGLADAQFDLAILYERGLGVPQNLTDAYRWYVIAAKSGDKESKDRVDALSSQLTSEDRSAAETAAAGFKPQPIKANANEPL